MKNYVHDGDRIEVAAPAAVASGDVVIVNSLIGVANSTGEAGDQVVVQTRGVFGLPKEAALAVDLGAAVYWDSANSVVTTSASGNTPIGYAAAAAIGSAALLDVRIG